MHQEQEKVGAEGVGVIAGGTAADPKLLYFEMHGFNPKTHTEPPSRSSPRGVPKSLNPKP